MLATSPQVYSSTNPSQAGPVRLVAAAASQGECQSCVAFAVRAAAETAMAAALGVDVQRCSISVQALCIVEARVIGVMQMIDSGDADDKIIAVASTDPSVNYINNIEEMPAHFFNELRHFFEEYKKLENKTVVVEEFQDKATALKIISDAIALYRETFMNK